MIYSAAYNKSITITDVLIADNTILYNTIYDYKNGT